MSLRALNTAASGMGALQFKLDTIANNLANASTTAFKRNRANFEDLFYQQLKMPGITDNAGQLTPVGVSVGLGTRVQSTQIDQRPGSLLTTDGELDLAIIGDGLFQVNDGQQILYSRAGNFTLNAQGQMVLASQDRGRPLEPPVTFPPDATNISIGQDGLVTYLAPGQTQLSQAGQIQLARFINAQGLLQKGENLYQQTEASGQPNVSNPGQDGLGVLRQRFLEASNVEPVRELVDLITTQRSFELSSQVVQVADQALQLVANLRRF